MELTIYNLSGKIDMVLAHIILTGFAPGYLLRFQTLQVTQVACFVISQEHLLGCIN